MFKQLLDKVMRLPVQVVLAGLGLVVGLLAMMFRRPVEQAQAQAPVQTQQIDTTVQEREAQHVAQDIQHLNQELNTPVPHADATKPMEDLVDEYNRL